MAKQPVGKVLSKKAGMAHLQALRDEENNFAARFGAHRNGDGVLAETKADAGTIEKGQVRP